MKRRTRQIPLLKAHLSLMASNIRTYLVYILLYFYIRALISPINHFAQSVGYRPTPFAYVFLCNDEICALFLALGAVALFSSAPFLSKMHKYLAIWTDHKALHLSHVLYICIASGIYVLFCVFSSVLPSIASGGIDLSTQWGKIWQTLAQTSAAQEFEMKIGIPAYIPSEYTPLQALGLTMFLQFFFVAFLGMISYIGNSIHPSVGTILAAAISFLDITITNLLPYAWYHLSPLSLTRLGVLIGNSVNKAPCLLYAVLFLPILCIASGIYIVYSKINTQG